jgi:hypothetical protein
VHTTQQSMSLENHDDLSYRTLQFKVPGYYRGLRNILYLLCTTQQPSRLVFMRKLLKLVRNSRPLLEILTFPLAQQQHDLIYMMCSSLNKSQIKVL